MATTTQRGIGFAILAASIYALVPNFARLAFLNGVPALETVTVRTLAVVVFLGLAAKWRGLQLQIPGAAGGAFMAQAIATFLVSSCYLASLQYLSVGLSVVIFFTFPVLIALSSTLIEGRKPPMLLYAMTLLAFAGLVTAIGPELSDINPLGLLLAALAAVGCVLQFFSGRALGRHVDPTVGGTLVHLAILPFVLLATYVTGNGKIAILSDALSAFALFAVLLVGLAYSAAYFLHMSSVKQAPASIVAPYFNLEPMISTLLAVLLLGESLSTSHIIGGLMILVALIVSGFATERKILT